jgi:hypothetical protein
MASIDGVIVLACHEVWWCLEIWHGRSIVLSEEINQHTLPAVPIVGLLLK